MDPLFIEKNNTLNAAYNDSSIIVTTKYYEYVALLFTAILLIMLFFRFNNTSATGQIGGGGKNYCIFKIAIAIVFIVFYFNRKIIARTIGL